ncbi:MAG: hypothetical protein LBB23_00025 [Rickettsiales bacterium]|nr:hypothetical protein [Rickettsiales bacterium]
MGKSQYGKSKRVDGSNHPVRLRFATARHPATIGGDFLLTTTPSGFAVHPFASEGDFVRLSSTNHPVRLRFATARHPFASEGDF